MILQYNNKVDEDFTTTNENVTTREPDLQKCDKSDSLEKSCRETRQYIFQNCENLENL